MNTFKGDVLAQAYELIEADKLDDAKAILKSALETDKDNPDAWWLFAHAVQDPETARIALNNVLRLDSEYPEASDLLKTLEQQSPSDAVLDFHKDPAFLPNVPGSLPDLPESDMDFDDFDEDEESETFFRRPVFLISLIAILLIIAIVIVVVRPFGGTSTPDATQVIDQPTLVAVTATDVIQTSATVPSQSVDDPFEALRPMLSAFTLSDNGIQLNQTSLGNTLIVQVCTTPGRELRSTLPQVVDALAKANNTYTNQADAIGVQMVDCQTSANLLAIGVSLSDAVAYANGDLTEEDFQARWKPLT